MTIRKKFGPRALSADYAGISGRLGAIIFQAVKRIGMFAYRHKSHEVLVGCSLILTTFNTGAIRTEITSLQTSS